MRPKYSFPRQRHASLVFIAAFACACQPSATAMTDMEKQHMQKITGRMVTRCVGRFLVDVPENMVISTEGGQDVEGVTVSVEPMPEKAFDAVLRTRKTELENTFLPGKDKFPFLRAAIALPGGAKGLVFDRAESVAGTSRMGRRLELMAWKGGYRVKATVRAVDTDFSEFANDAWIKETKTTTPEKLALLMDVFRRTSGRADSEIPSGKGTCILNGFVGGPATDEENVTVFYSLEQAQDVFFRFNTDSTHTRVETLVERGKNIEALLAQGEGSTLRRAKRTVGGVSDGEELLYKMLGDPDSERQQIMTYKFLFEANNKIGSAQTPLIAIDLTNGEMKPMPDRKYDGAFAQPTTKATLSQAEALALWDTVIPTLRPRPNAF